MGAHRELLPADTQRSTYCTVDPSRPSPRGKAPEAKSRAARSVLARVQSRALVNSAGEPFGQDDDGQNVNQP
jgi:hypothetical protein